MGPLQSLLDLFGTAPIDVQQEFFKMFVLDVLSYSGVLSALSIFYVAILNLLKRL